MCKVSFSGTVKGYDPAKQRASCRSPGPRRKVRACAASPKITYFHNTQVCLGLVQLARRNRRLCGAPGHPACTGTRGAFPNQRPSGNALNCKAVVDLMAAPLTKACAANTTDSTIFHVSGSTRQHIAQHVIFKPDWVRPVRCEEGLCSSVLNMPYHASLLALASEPTCFNLLLTLF